MEEKLLTGVDFAGMLMGAAAHVANNRERLNELNVFPVPDGDTGTNMSLTLQAAAEALASAPAGKLGDTAGKVASALLRGARGNSGVITSLLFRGMARKFKNHDTADGVLFAEGLRAGVEAAYGAVMKPAEGTVLTVSRLAAEAAGEVAGESSPEEILEVALEAGKKALADTPKQNPVLAKAGVVDAGGQGYIFILEGFLAALRGEKEELQSSAEASSAFDKFDTGDITFAYCTEFLISKNPEAPSALKLRAFLENMGDCVVVVDDEEIIKVHCHSNHPGKVMEEALNYGSLIKIKVENMKEQHTGLLTGKGEAGAPAEEKEEPVGDAAPTEEYGFVTVSCGEGLTNLFKELGATGIVEGGQTMNPSTEDILREIRQTPAKNVFVLPNNKNIELAARQTVGLAEGKNILVLSTHSIPQGVGAMLAFDPETSPEKNLEEMMAAAGRVTTGSITYAARDSVFEGREILKGQFLTLKDGKVISVTDSIEEAAEAFFRAVPEAPEGLISVYSGADVSEEDAETMAAMVQSAYPLADVSLVEGGQPIYYYLFSVE